MLLRLEESAVMPESPDSSVSKNPLVDGDALFEVVMGILLRHDPLDINYGNAREEYRPIVRSIMQVLKGCRSEDEACELVQKELSKSLRPYEDAADYRSIAAEIWEFLESNSSV